jgi:hypothetical protein
LRYAFVVADPRTHAHFADTPLTSCVTLDQVLLKELREPGVVAQRLAQIVLNTVSENVATYQTFFMCSHCFLSLKMHIELLLLTSGVWHLALVRHSNFFLKMNCG